MVPPERVQPVQGGLSSFATALSSQHWARALGISRREDIRQLKKKKRYAQAFHSV
jgi:hypothetical protein